MSSSQTATNPDQPLGGRYKIISKLGTGGFGKTFLAEDLHLPGQPRCVVKQLKPKAEDEETLQMARRLFNTEAEVLYQLGDHDQIPRLLAHFEDDQEFYLAQELIEGKPLTKELVKGQLWHEAKVITLLQDILEVLTFVHEQRVIHRDIKPPNLIRREQDGKIVLIDFGAVKQVSMQQVDHETGQTNLTISIGTQGYMPNEQLAGKPRFSSDIYAVGLIGIQAVTGIHPKRLGEHPETGEINWQERAKQISPELTEILDRMVRYDFRSRYQRAIDALEAIHCLLPTSIESALQPQLAPETTDQEAEIPTTLSSSPASTESEAKEPSEKPLPTDVPPTESLGKPHSSSNSADSTELISEVLPIHTSESSALVKPSSELMTRQWLKFWPLPVILVSVGATFLVTKALLFGQSNELSSHPSASPTPISVVESPPVTPKKQVAELLKEAESLSKAQQYQEALAVYSQLIKFASKHSDINFKSDLAKAYWGSCYSLNQLQQPAEAIVACNDALDLKPDYAEAIWGKGRALEQQQQPLESMWLYEKATGLKPDFTEAWISLGAARQGFGRSVEAIEALDKAIELKRDSAQAWTIKGEALSNLGRFDQAIAALDKALQIEPDYQQAIELREKIPKE
ncbi:MAG: serine/threonine-protein kinase [Coleofasciculaceae cyanobacterium]